MVLKSAAFAERQSEWRSGAVLPGALAHDMIGYVAASSYNPGNVNHEAAEGRVEKTVFTTGTPN